MAGLRCQKCLGTLLVNKVRAMLSQMMSAAARIQLQVAYDCAAFRPCWQQQLLIQLMCLGTVGKAICSVCCSSDFFFRHPSILCRPSASMLLVSDACMSWCVLLQVNGNCSCSAGKYADANFACTDW